MQWCEHSPPTSVARSIHGHGVICGLSLLLVLILAPRGFSLDTPVFSSPQKTNISKFQFDQEKCPQLVLCAKYIDT